MAKEYSDIKKRAMLAKKRMKMGYWQKLQQEKSEMLKNMSGSEEDKKLASEVQREKYKRDVNRAMNKNKSDNDEVMYQKIKEMLDENECVLNPIGTLIDQQLYSSMDEPNKQRYVLELAAKYRELRERYYRERIGNPLDVSAKI